MVGGVFSRIISMLCYSEHANEVANALSENMPTNMIELMACK